MTNRLGPNERRGLPRQAREVLCAATQREPGAFEPATPTLFQVAEELVEARFLGRVEVRGEIAYRLTGIGRAAIAQFIERQVVDA